jgi:hypothetical protein
MQKLYEGELHARFPYSKRDQSYSPPSAKSNFGNMFQRQERGCQLLLMVKFFVWPGKQYEYILRRGCQLLPMMYPGIKGELRLSSSARILTFTKQGWISPGCSSCRSGDIPVGGCGFAEGVHYRCEASGGYPVPKGKRCHHLPKVYFALLGAVFRSTGTRSFPGVGRQM